MGSKKELNFSQIYKEIDDSLFIGDEQWIELFQYEGFNPKKVAALIMERGGRNAKEDITKMITLAVERGSKISKIKEKSSEKAVSVIAELVTRYHLKDNTSGSKTDITLPRVCLSFPWATCGYYHKHYSRDFVVPGHMLTSNYPACMRTPAFASMIPKEFSMILCPALGLHQYHFTRIITKRATDRSRVSVSEMKEEIMKYISAGVNSEFVPNDVKIRYCKTWKVINDLGELADEVYAAAKQFEEMM